MTIYQSSIFLYKGGRVCSTNGRTLKSECCSGFVPGDEGSKVGIAEMADMVLMAYPLERNRFMPGDTLHGRKR